MAANPPDAFLSYTRFDDRRSDISAFREALSEAVREVTGEPFGIFQDVDDIEIGKRWSHKLDDVLTEARFFIPILTPSYFRSAACRDELEKFLNAEERAGRDDLILPIYYIRCPVLEEKELREADHLATAIHQRQRWDWRELRHYSLRNRKVRLKIEALALDIARARQTRVTRRIAAPTTSSAEPTAPPIPADEPTIIQQSAPRQRHARDSLALPDSGRASRPETLRPGTVFRDIDAPWCPELVVIPPGEFLMGSSDDDAEAYDDEKPQHRVRIAYPLAIGRYPVTFGEYDHFCEQTRRQPPDDQAWGRGRRPVINVSWDDAKAYVEWLAADTGQPYRLLSEAEWEYACRAGTTTRYWWGDDISEDKANRGNRTSEVGSYPASPFGLYDMHGNVWEWVEDRWHGTYEGAPADGAAWLEGKNSGRVVRGGSWDNNPWILRAACRNCIGTDFRDYYLGFRVARTFFTA
jgi:formylglycine-generating enzyme required for sulfatase activity